MSTRFEPNTPLRKVAFFISPHGFGHAARAASVMEALAEIEPSLQFDIFTTVPDWFFAQSNTFRFCYHRLRTDVGLVQVTPFQEDLPATVQNLQNFLPFDHSQIAVVAQKVRHLKSELVDFIENNMHGFAISESEFHTGSWTARLEHLLTLPRTERNTSNGARQMAEYIGHRFEK